MHWGFSEIDIAGILITSLFCSNIREGCVKSASTVL
jgi:hypothetical protein